MTILTTVTRLLLETPETTDSTVWLFTISATLAVWFVAGLATVTRLWLLAVLTTLTSGFMTGLTTAAIYPLADLATLAICCCFVFSTDWATLTRVCSAVCAALAGGAGGPTLCTGAGTLDLLTSFTAISVTEIVGTATGLATRTVLEDLRTLFTTSASLTG